MKKGSDLAASVVIYLLAFTGLSGQKTLIPEMNPPNARFYNFLVKEGEANQASTSILIDHYGFIWTGTETGLYRFDGVRYLEYGVSMTDSSGFYGYGTNYLFEDHEGTIWLGTSGALNRLDQQSGTFRHYFPDLFGRDQSNNTINIIQEDSQGLLWIKTGKDIFSFDKKRETFRQYSIEPDRAGIKSSLEYPDNFLAEDRKGNRFFTAGGSLYLLGKDSDKLINVLLSEEETSGKKIRSVNSVITGRDGTLWIGTEGGGLYRWHEDSAGPEQIDLKANLRGFGNYNDITSVFEDRQGRIWAFGSYTFSVYDPSDGAIDNYRFSHSKRIPYEPKDSEAWISRVFELSDGSIWFLDKAWGSMYRFEPGEEKLCVYRVPNYMVFQCAIDRTEAFWFATIRNNLFRLVLGNMPYTWINITNQSEVDPVHKKRIYMDHENNIWLASKNLTYFISDFNTGRSVNPVQFRMPGGDSIFRSIVCDSRGMMWFGGRFGNVTRYDPETRKEEIHSLYISEGKTSYDGIPLINEDAEGNMWFAPYERGLYRYVRSEGRFEFVIPYANFLPQTRDHTMIDYFIDSNGDHWLLTIGGVFTMSMPGMKLTEHKELYPDGVNSINRNIRIVEDSRKNIWLLQELGGIYLLDRESGMFRRHGLNDSSPARQYYDMNTDSRGRLWTGHNKGITVTDPESCWSRTILIPKLQFDLHSYLTRTGFMLYINDNQLLIFREDIPVNNYIPDIYIAGLKVNGADYHKISDRPGNLSTLREIDLPYRQNSVAIEFAALNYLEPAQNRYRWFLKGVDKDTIESEAGSKAVYQRIPPGRYQLWFTGSNNDGLWNHEGKTLGISIRIPWYRSASAYAGYLLIITALIAFYIRLRTRRLRQEKKKLEAEVEKHTRDLEIKNRLLAENDLVKTRFFTDISHEIRTPLSLITGPLETILTEETLSEKGARMAGIISRNSHRLSQLVNQLLDIARLDTGSMKITLSEGDILKSLRILVYDYLSLAESRHINYVVDIPEGEFMVLFDRDKIEKIVSNLLSNAFKFSNEGGTVQFRAYIDIDPVLLTAEITDTGIGIDKEHIDRIFDRFYRVEGRHETERRGTGIGLSLVSEFVNLMHGTISVASEPGKGSRFTVKIPLGKEHLAAEEFRIISQPEKNAAEYISQVNEENDFKENHLLHLRSKPRLLVIEDNQDLRNYVKENLSDIFSVVTADNGTTGLSMAFTIMPDLIITDIMMPGIDGMRLCKQLKNNEITSHVPVIMLTARAAEKDKLEGLMAGADDYIMKPFSIVELKTKVTNMLRMRERLRARYSGFRGIDDESAENLSVDDLFMNRLLTVINDNISDFRLDVAFLQERMGMSRVHLTRKLKLLTGISPGVLIRNIRMEKAADLISHHSGNITEVANRIGMSNPSHFTRVFRKHYGISPKEYGRNERIR
jgi:signal transduction histidine kinase/DNA-binding response OmpR family regulator/ligand-binding sensor domain-containing protein